MKPVLEVEELGMKYGGASVLYDISLAIELGEMVGIIGSNGAGKSTLLKAIVGLVRPWHGKITFNGEDITALPTHKRCSRGLVLVPEGRQLFTSLSVMDNLLMGAYSRAGRETSSEFLQRLELVYSLFPTVKERQRQNAGSLSGGEQQMLAIGRAIMSKPRLLLCDELSLGLAPRLVKEIYSALRELRQQEGISIVVVEQQARVILGLAQRVYIIETGRITLSGTAEELLESEVVKKAYLGIV